MTDTPWTIYPCDCRDAMGLLMQPDSVDSIVTDPPYDLTSIVKRFGKPGSAPAQHGTDGAFARASAGFMGKQWDGTGVAFEQRTWAEAYRVLKPGGYLLAFGGTRTFHRMVCAIEDAGFEIRDCISWVYGSGFPKSLDVSKALDKMAGAERGVVGDSPYAARKPNGSAGVNSVGLSAARGSKVTAPATPEAQQWQGWGTALKPATEPICVARKPLSESSVAANVLRWGTGAINIDGARVPTAEEIKATRNIALGSSGSGVFGAANVPGVYEQQPGGRFPANLIHDGSDAVAALFPDSKGSGPARTLKRGTRNDGWGMADQPGELPDAGSGSAARFFYAAEWGDDDLPRLVYCPKASKADRNSGGIVSSHPTVKPESLMRYLVRLVTPPGGTVFDPFTGSGSTGKAALLEGFRFVGCELTPEYLPIIEARLTDAAKRARGES